MTTTNDPALPGGSDRDPTTLALEVTPNLIDASPTERGMVPARSSFVTPATDIDTAVAAFEQYQALKERLGTAEDFVQRGGKRIPKKSFVRKMQKFFGLSTSDLLRDEPIREGGRITGWLCAVKVTHPAGASQIGDGAVEFAEKACRTHLPRLDQTCNACMSNATLHNVRAHARTRAQNRAVMDLVGFGDVTADEMPADLPDTRNRGGGKFRSGDRGFGECPIHPGWWFEEGNYGPAHPVEGETNPNTGKPRWCNPDRAQAAPADEAGRSSVQMVMDGALAAVGGVVGTDEREPQMEWIKAELPELSERHPRQWMASDWVDITKRALERIEDPNAPVLVPDDEAPSAEASNEPTDTENKLPW